MVINDTEYEAIVLTEKNGALVEVNDEALEQFGIESIALKKKRGREGASTAGSYNCPFCIHNFEDRFPDQFDLALWCRNCKAGSNFRERPLLDCEKINYGVIQWTRNQN